jgi:hypothetical protein
LLQNARFVAVAAVNATKNWGHQLKRTGSNQGVAG